MSDDTFGGRPWEDLDTHPPGDRAETRAREWLAPVASLDQVHSLAAQFREERQHTLAEVRRVVEEEMANWENDSGALVALRSVMEHL